MQSVYIATELQTCRQGKQMHSVMHEVLRCYQKQLGCYTSIRSYSDANKQGSRANANPQNAQTLL